MAGWVSLDKDTQLSNNSRTQERNQGMGTASPESKEKPRDRCVQGLKSDFNTPPPTRAETAVKLALMGRLLRASLGKNRRFPCERGLDWRVTFDRRSLVLRRVQHLFEGLKTMNTNDH